MEEYELNLFSCPAYLACAFLDKRCKPILDENQVILAKQHIIKLYEYIHRNQLNNCKQDKRLKSKTSGGQDNDARDDNQTNDVPTNISRIERFLLSKEKAASQENSPPGSVPIGENTIDDLLIEFEQLPRAQIDLDVLKYWENQKGDESRFFELYKVAQIIMATPATEVSVERAFSTLHFILNNYRSRLSNQQLEDILIVKLNSNFNL